MAHQHRGRGQRREYVKRFIERYGMDRAEFRILKKENPKKANELRLRARKMFMSRRCIEVPNW